MRVLALGGQRSAALRQYETCRRILEAELGVEPMEETTTLYEQIQTGTLARPAARPLPIHSLPPQPTSFVGRGAARAELAERLTSRACRLLTLVGPPGIGKTRLGLEVAVDVALDFDDGVTFVALAPIADPALVGTIIAHALGIREVSNQPLVDSLKAYLRDKQQLLVLDNFEHVLDAAPLVGELLTVAPQLKVLVTSRALLHLSGEQELAVPPLAVPDRSIPPEVALLAQYEAVALFVQRAQTANPAFQLSPANAGAVAEICARLDGLPLAIELAAARSKVLSPAALLARLGSRLQVLTGGPRDLPTRQQTLRATIAWSYNLLGVPEQILFRCFGIFAGGWTLEAAEAVGRGPSAVHDAAEGSATGHRLPASSHGPPTTIVDGLQVLVDKSLVQQAAAMDGEPRFTMLETIREYALERLAAHGELPEARTRHAAYYLALAEAGEGELHGPQQLIWLDRLEREHDNLRAALAWALEGGDGALGLHLAGALCPFWELHWHIHEGLHWLEGALGSGQGQPAALRAKAQIAAGRLAQMQGDWTRASELLEAGLALAREAGDRALEGQALLHLGTGAWNERDAERATALLEASLACARAVGDQVSVGWALQLLGLTANFRCEWDHGVALYAESLACFRAVGDRSGISWALFRLGQVAGYQGKLDQATRLLEESLALCRKLGDKGRIGGCLMQLAELAVSQSDYPRARALTEESLALAREIDARGIIDWARNVLASILRDEGDYTQAQALAEESLTLSREAGGRGRLLGPLNLLGGIMREQGDYARATALLEECLTIARELGDRAFCLWPLHELGETALLQGDETQAQRREEECLVIAREIGNEYGIGLALLNLGHLAQHAGDYARARALLEESLAYMREVSDPIGIACCLAALTGVTGRQGEAERAVRLFGAVEAIFERLQVVPGRAHRIEMERNVAAVRVELDEATFATGWAEGRAMAVEQAIAYALEPSATFP
jgi:predicted ATPase/uncharacterized protein HemY